MHPHTDAIKVSLKQQEAPYHPEGSQEGAIRAAVLIGQVGVKDVSETQQGDNAVEDVPAVAEVVVRVQRNDL